MNNPGNIITANLHPRRHVTLCRITNLAAQETEQYFFGGMNPHSMTQPYSAFTRHIKKTLQIVQA